jgi:large conductance mechanosensitive channel
MSILEEFKKFVARGNVVDLAVGVIIGAAFGKITESAVKDLVMPIIGMAGTVDFSNLYFPLSSKVPLGLTLDQARALGPVFAYGSFFTVVLNFLIVAFCVFLMMKGFNALRKRQEAAEKAAPAVPPEPSDEVKLLREIRDLLKK